MCNNAMVVDMIDKKSAIKKPRLELRWSNKNLAGSLKQSQAAKHDEMADDQTDKSANMDVDDRYSSVLGKLIDNLEPYISRDKEVALAKKMRIATQNIKKFKQARKEAKIAGCKAECKKIKLSLKVAKNQYRQYREELIKGNMRVALFFAKNQYFSQGLKRRGVELADAIQQGYMGLMKAVMKFDYHLGFRVMSYAKWQIKVAIDRATHDTARVIKIPVNKEDAMSRMHRIDGKLRSKLERKPELSEIAAVMEKPIEYIEELHRLQNEIDIVYFSTPISSDDGKESDLGTHLSDKKAHSPEQIFVAMEQNGVWEYARKILSPRQFEVIWHRFHPDHMLTLQELGDKQGVTRERIRQIEKIALTKLKHPKHRDKFAQFAL